MVYRYCSKFYRVRPLCELKSKWGLEEAVDKLLVPYFSSLIYLYLISA